VTEYLGEKGEKRFLAGRGKSKNEVPGPRNNLNFLFTWSLHTNGKK
jgi:hypothetical protein